MLLQMCVCVRVQVFGSQRQQNITAAALKWIRFYCARTQI